MTRDQIIDEMKAKRFSVRQVFYNTLGHCADRPTFKGSEALKIDWWQWAADMAYAGTVGIAGILIAIAAFKYL